MSDYYYDTILNFSSASSIGISPYTFTSLAKIVVNDRDTNSYVGRINYANPAYEFLACIKIRECIFTLERLVPFFKQAFGHMNDCYYIGCFNGNKHCVFSQNYEPSYFEQNKPGDTLIDYVVSSFWGIFFPDCFDHHANWQNNTPLYLTWYVEKLKQEEAVKPTKTNA